MCWSESHTVARKGYTIFMNVWAGVFPSQAIGREREKKRERACFNGGRVKRQESGLFVACGYILAS